MNCCSTSSGGISRHFSRKSEAYARGVRKGKLEPIQKLLIAGAERIGVQNRRLLDVGCGAGALHLELLRRGATSAVGVDLSPDMISQAAGIAEARGLIDRVSYRVGDAVVLRDELGPADITMMDKVVCCYGDLPALIAVATECSGEGLVLSYPRNNWLVRTSFRLEQSWARFRNDDFVPFWHDWEWMKREIELCGFRLLGETNTLMWTAAVFKRNSATGRSSS